ncbi:hypothetical protein ACB092_01G111800, partial [Castanea dentata]
MQFLMGLNDSFSHIRGQILLMDPIPSVEKVFSLLIQDEKQRSVGHGSNNGPFVESTALAAKAMNLDSKTFKKTMEKPTCSHCGLHGHTLEKCYKLHGYPPGYKTKPRANQVSSFDADQESVAVTTQQAFPFTMEQCRKLLAMIGGNDAQANIVAMANNVALNQASCSQSTPLAGNLKHSIFSAKLVNRTAFGVDTWVMDIGASDHIVCSISLFQSYTTVSHCVVELPNGESAHVTHIGIVKLSNFLILEHVLCVPSFSFNLLFVSQLTQRLPLCLVFLSQYCFIQDLSCWKTIGVGEVHNGLYLLQKRTSRTTPS